MKRTLFLASILGVSMAVQATDAAAAPAADAAPAPAAQNQPVPEPLVNVTEQIAKINAANQPPMVVPPAGSEADVKRVEDRAPQPVPAPRPNEQFVNTNGNPPVDPQGPAAPAHPRAVPEVGLIKNSVGVFLIGLFTAGVATKAFIAGLNAQKELAETAEGKLDEQHKPKKKGAKDCWKSIWEKGFYVGTALVGSWFITHMLETRAKFNLQSWLIGEDQKTADKRARMQAGHANCSHD